MKFISDKNINVNDLIVNSVNPSSGGLVVFLGTVRNVNHSKKVSYLEYEAYVPMANKMIAKILAKAKVKWNLHEAKCVHRIGKVDISETAVVVITASKHRKEAYEANQYIIHELKHEVPIWKKECYVDGAYEWGNNCDCVNHDEEEELVSYI